MFLYGHVGWQRMVSLTSHSFDVIDKEKHMSTLQEIILEAVKRGVPVSLGYNKITEQIFYEVSGFAKSGNVKLEQDGETIKVTARYSEVDTIENFEDLAYIARYWHNSYKDRGYTLDEYWLDVFVEYGWITRKETVVVSYE